MRDIDFIEMNGVLVAWDDMSGAIRADGLFGRVHQSTLRKLSARQSSANVSRSRHVGAKLCLTSHISYETVSRPTCIHAFRFHEVTAP